MIHYYHIPLSEVETTLTTGRIPRAFAESRKIVLNPRTGHVSPQFHVKFDDFFETVQDKSTDMDAPELDWKYLSGFVVKKGRPEPADRGIANDLLSRDEGQSVRPNRHQRQKMRTRKPIYQKSQQSRMQTGLLITNKKICW